MLYDKKVHPCYIYMILMANSHTGYTKNQQAYPFWIITYMYA